MRSVRTTFLMILSVCHALAQERMDERPLTEVISELQESYDVKFSYVDELVHDKLVALDTRPGQQVESLLKELERKLKMRFEQVNDHYILVRPFMVEDEIPVCGYVVDEEDNPIADLVIQADAEGTGAITDRNGFFQFRAPYGAVLNFRHLGFVTKQAPANTYLNTECVTITMKSAFSMLEELTIQDYLTVGISKYRNEITIRPQELKILPGLIEPDILQSIQQAPGVSSPYETASGIHVRGGAPDQNLVLWNGIKTYHQAHFFGMLSAFNPYITNKVDFIKNGTSARYGGRVSSVIDIRTSEDVAPDFSGGAGFNMIYGDAYVNTPVIKDKLSVLISGRRSYTDLMETFTYQQFSDRVFQNTKINDEASSGAVETDNSFYFNDFNTSVVFQPTAKDKILLNTLYTKNDLDFSSFDANEQREFNDRLRTENEGYSLKWIHEADRFQFSADVNYARYLLQYRFLNTYQDTTETSSKKNLINDLGGRADVEFHISDQHHLRAGYEFSDNNTRYAFEDTSPLYHLVLDQDNRTVRTHSGYSEYQFEGERTYVSAGARVNHYSGLDKWYVEPRVYLQQRLADPLHISASGEYKTQVISQIKESVVSDLSLENQLWKLASKERFPVIESYQLTSGMAFAKNGWQLDMEAYYKKIDGVTSLTFGFLNPVDNEYRSGNSTIRGTDVFLKKQLDQYKSWVGYTYIYTENRFTGLNNDEPFPGNWNIEHQVKWSHFYTWDKLQFSLGWTWHTGKAYTEVTESSSGSGPVVVEYNGINEQNLPVYHRLDFSAVYDFTLGQNDRVNYRLGLSVLNIYDRKNLLNREFRTTPSLENELIDTRIYSLGITPNLVFRVFW